MKLFIFSFTLGLAVSGLFFVRLSHVEQVPEAIQALTIQGVDGYRSMLVWCRDDLLKGLWMPSGVEVRALVAGMTFFVIIWWVLAFFRGLPGFFRDLGAFFPISR
jgi:hypothetical protein